MSLPDNLIDKLMFNVTSDGVISMTCEDCKREDCASLYRHPVTEKRYCQQCWWKVRPAAPIAIDQCSEAVKNAAAMAARKSVNMVWEEKSQKFVAEAKPIRAIITQMINGVPVKVCWTCKKLVLECPCETSASA